RRAGSLMPRAFLLVAAALGVLAGAAARADADSVGTFQADVTVTYQFSGIECPAGTTATTVCFSVLPHRTNTVAGLGEVGIAATTAVWENFRAPCGRFSLRLPVVVKDKGEIDLAVAVSGCWTSDDFPPAAATVTGGSGRYAGASG